MNRVPSSSVETPSLSVCISVGPGEDFGPLECTLDSIARQTSLSVEAFVKVFDGHLAAEVRDYAATRPHVKVALRSSKDVGPYDSFNECAANALGSHILYLGCGDVLADADVVRDLIRCLAGHPSSRVVYGTVLLADRTGKIEGKFPISYFDGTRKRLPWRNPCHSQGLIYRRSWLLRHPFDTTVGPLSDLVHTHSNRIYAHAQHIERTVAIFRSGGASNRIGLRDFRAQLRGVLANCANFRFPPIWRLLSTLVVSTRFVRNMLLASRRQ
jgi:hypothetical protein